MGNAFPSLSSDPSAQWPGSSGVEHLFYWGLWVGAAIPGAPTPEELERMRAELSEMGERVDFTERLLARQREVERLPGESA